MIRRFTFATSRKRKAPATTDDVIFVPPPREYSALPIFSTAARFQASAKVLTA